MQQYVYSKDDLSGILKNLVITGERWECYEHTKEVAEFWQKIITGKNHDTILLMLKPGEKPELKKQRVRLYNSRTKYVANKIITQIQEVYRSDNIFNDIYFKEKKDDAEEKIKRLNDNLKNFSGKKSVRAWLRDRYLRLNIIDPNSFIVVNFKSDGKKINGFFPVEVRSKDVLSRQYLNGTLQYLAFKETVQQKINLGGKVKTVTGYKYWIFGHDWAILLHKCPQGGEGIGTPIDIQQADPYDNQWQGSDVTYSWFYDEYNIKAQQVPAFCVGYVPDPENDDKTFESILYPSKELFIELIWKKNTYDIHMTLHGVAQKFAFVPTCDYTSPHGHKCQEGHIAETGGSECPQCKGSGQMPFHTSEQDIITISLPKDKNELWDLSKMIYYQEFPENIIKMTRDEIKETEKAISLAIFNTSIIDRGELLASKTATEIRADFNATNNVLYNFGLYDADVYKNIVNQIAIYSNLWAEDLVIDYSYPNDFNLESANDLLLQLKDSDASHAPNIVRRKITSKLISKLCIDNKSAIQDYETREYWRPFPNDTLAMSAPEYDRSRILWLYFNQIFRTLENQSYSADTEQGIPFYSLPREKQKELIEAEVEIYLAQYRQAKNEAPVITVPRLA